MTTTYDINRPQLWFISAFFSVVYISLSFLESFHRLALPHQQPYSHKTCEIHCVTWSVAHGTTSSSRALNNAFYTAVILIETGFRQYSQAGRLSPIRTGLSGAAPAFPLDSPICILLRVIIIIIIIIIINEFHRDASLTKTSGPCVSVKCASCYCVWPRAGKNLVF